MSILSGFIGDWDARTLNFITQGRSNFDSSNKKIKYTIKKFHLDDLSNNFSLLFIPPIHPFLQLYCNGELWHPRTKIGKNLFEFNMIRIYGFSCNPFKFIYEFIQKCNYLISDKSIQELECLYQQYKSTGQISVWQKKYLKYKNKYLELKKYLLNKKVN
jgi:hypothetical protein